MPPLPIEAYQVGWVCALPKELTAARAMLDEEHEEFKSQAAQDDNSYVLGRIHDHNVVLACLPAGVYGTVSAATVAINMMRTFTSIRCGLMVGIGGGIPNLTQGVDIRLGDVVVSQPDGTHGGVVQYDLGKNLGQGTLERKGSLRPPPKFLLTALANLQSRHPIYGGEILNTLLDMIKRLPRLGKAGYMYPHSATDWLYCSNVDAHQEAWTCTQCQSGVIQRQPREDPSPEVHYGVIASGNELIKNAVERDRLGRELGAKCVEMEAAGLMNDFPCIVIRGICDYADSHKNNAWQEYAAATAAAFAKELLSIVKPTEVNTVKHATEVMKYNLGLNLFDAPDMGDDLFIGRQTEIQQMESILQPQSDTPSSSRKVLVLGGMGGIGKTQLAISYAKRHRHNYKSVFWLNATSEATLKDSFRTAAEAVFVMQDPAVLEGEQILIRIRGWLSDPRNSKWLLIFDNYDNPEQFKIAKYYPPASHGAIIVTTRLPYLIIGRIVRIQPLQKIEESLEILKTRSQRENVELDPYAKRLAERLAGLPLALATAGAFLHHSSFTFERYLLEYEKRWNIDPRRPLQLQEYQDRTLYTTWGLSYTRLESDDLEAAKLLKLLAYFDNQSIWYELLHVGLTDESPEWLREVIADNINFEGVMRTLTDYCFLEVQTALRS